MKDTASEEDLRPLISACRKINEQHCQCRCPATGSIPQPWGALSSSLLSQPLTLGHSRIVLLPRVIPYSSPSPRVSAAPWQGSRAEGEGTRLG